MTNKKNNTPTLNPTSDRVVLRRIKVDDKSSSGIILSTRAKKLSNHAEVLAVGPGMIMESGTLRPMRIAVGDHIIIGENASIQTEKFNGEDLVVISENGILAVIK